MSDDGHHHHHHHETHELRSQPVVLDLGDGVGALIVHTDPELLGVEVEISPSDDDGDRQHKEVLMRAMGRQTASVLVYDNLAEGSYTLWVNGEPWARNVQVAAGGVAEVDRRRQEVDAHD